MMCGIAGVVDIDLPAERNHEVTLTREFAEQKRAVLSLLKDAPEMQRLIQ